MSNQAPHEPTDGALLARVSKDPRAVGVLYRRHSDLLLRYFATRLRGDLVTAADLVTDTFVVVLTRSKNYKPREGPALAWIFGVARNKLVDYWRRQSIDSRARESISLDAPRFYEEDLDALVSRLDGMSLAESLRSALDQLPEADRLAIEAVYIDDESLDEAASRLSVSNNALRQRLHRGRNKLSNILNEES